MYIYIYICIYYVGSSRCIVNIIHAMYRPLGWAPPQVIPNVLVDVRPSAPPAETETRGAARLVLGDHSPWIFLLKKSVKTPGMFRTRSGLKALVV